jgi:hypothetical protein
MLVRAYDPCISCSVHWLKPRKYLTPLSFFENSTCLAWIVKFSQWETLSENPL